MKEYRIKAKSAEHRKAIIGALEGLGIEDPHEVNDDKDNERVGYFNLVGVAGGQLNMWHECGQYPATHTSLDSMIEDIIRDRQTVEVECGNFRARVSTEWVKLRFAGDESWLPLEFFDRITEAVNKVRNS